MLTQNQIGYLATVPEDKVAHVVAFDPAVKTTAEAIILELKKYLPDAKIYYIGSSKLGIAGENDIDLTILGEDQFGEYLILLEKNYGVPTRKNIEKKYVKWEFVRNGFEVELHLGSFMNANFQEQVDTQEILERNEGLRQEYEQIKLQCDGLPWKEYLTRKYEFWNKILEKHD